MHRCGADDFKAEYASIQEKPNTVPKLSDGSMCTSAAMMVQLQDADLNDALI